MEWILGALGVAVVGALGIWLARRGTGERDARPRARQHHDPRATPGIGDSMSVRLPTGGNSGA